ncbi:DUF4397 domain-containing protein [Natronincola ferrireducens]|uniref:DUF4397 domain-containing protein n=1 Tax=Natronincola ferrireducens TaxID=393762 RepID=A0A1G9GGA9_9FIRM|nr:DUF4397 domain-containing protein [Natronincola ferrireducens]SDK99681.1 protein of unknown function [Natronincola ferrireducens]
MRSYIRVFHAVPDAPAVDVYANDCLIVKNISYKHVSHYLSLPAGPTNIKIYPAGSRVNPVLDVNIVVPPMEILTVAAVGTLSTIELLVIEEPKFCAPYYKTNIRFGHLSPNAPTVDITLKDGTVIFSNVSFKDVTDYIRVAPGIYELQVRIAGTNQVVLNLPSVALNPKNFYTIYAVGLVGEMPPLEALLSLDRVC